MFFPHGKIVISLFQYGIIEIEGLNQLGDLFLIEAKLLVGFVTERDLEKINHRFIQIGGDLADITDMTSETNQVMLPYFLILEGNGSGKPLKKQDRFNQGGFSTARFTLDQDFFSGTDGQVDAGDDGLAFFDYLQILNFNQYLPQSETVTVSDQLYTAPGLKSRYLFIGNQSVE